MAPLHYVTILTDTFVSCRGGGDRQATIYCEGSKEEAITCGGTNIQTVHISHVAYRKNC